MASADPPKGKTVRRPGGGSSPLKNPRAAPTIASLSGEGMRAHLDDLARLRIEVFRAWPYLYKGSLGYEREYLGRYAEADTGTLIVAMDGDRIVGASTALGLDEEDDFVQAPFVAAGMDLGGIFYFGESVLLAPYRGQGLGVRFFQEREAAAARHGYGICVFCAVSRPDNHPARPKNYVPLDEFWRHRGYSKRPDLVSKFSWRDIGERNESEKPMIYWMKTL
jgi:GNAT superfamily N-acetyltransferase